MSFLPAFLSDSLDEVVFENRNQAYGAYQLRLGYQRNLASAGGITLALLALVLLGWAGWRQLAPEATPVTIFTHEVKPMIITPPTPTVIEHPKVAPALPRARPAATHPAAPATPTQVAKDELVPPRPTPLVPAAIVDGPVGPAAVSVGEALATTEIGGVVGSSEVGTTAPASNEPFVSVERMPEFAGGQAALLRYLRSHLRYPSAALAAGVGGRVFLSFVVRADGSIADVTVLKGLGYGLDEEAQRVVRQMPGWTPGYQSQHPVAVRFTLPITFQYQ